MEFTEKELAAFREEVCKGASDAQFDLFISEARARDLRPGTHLFFQLRNVNEWDADVGAKVRKQRATWITKIDAFRLISQRSGKDAGRGKTRWIYLDEQKRPVIESTVPLPHPTLSNTPLEPYACVVPIYRSDYKEPIEVVCRFDAFAVTMKQNNQLVLTDMWQRRGPEQLEKCSEVASRRAAYPESLGSLYIAEEFKNEDEPEKPTAVTPASVVPLPPTAPKVDQTPAVGREEPRPGEKLPIDKATLAKIEEAASNPVVIAKLAEEGKQINQEALAALRKEVETPAEKPKRGRKPKESPVNGPVPGEITQADIDTVENNPSPEPEVDQKPAAEAFVAGLDPTPTKEEMVGFTTRVRALTAKGRKSDEIKEHVLKVAGPPGHPETDTKKVTVGAWKRALDELENPKPATEEFK